MGKISLLGGVTGVFLSLAGCGATPAEDMGASLLELSRDASAEVVPVKLIPLGQVALAPDGSGHEADIDPPYRRPVTETSERLRVMSLEAQRLEANDPENFYVMRIDMQTGDVLAVARSKAAAAARSQQLAPDGEAPAKQDDPDEVVPKSLSDNVENRVLVDGAAYDSNVAISTTGAFDTDGHCSGSLFAGYTVVSAAHCAIKASGPECRPYILRPDKRALRIVRLAKAPRPTSSTSPPSQA